NDSLAVPANERVISSLDRCLLFVLMAQTPRNPSGLPGPASQRREGARVVQKREFPYLVGGEQASAEVESKRGGISGSAGGAKALWPAVHGNMRILPCDVSGLEQGTRPGQQWPLPQYDLSAPLACSH